MNLAKQEGVELFMEDNCDLRGQSKTRSLMEVTDSAAGATALSCGVRVINGTLGVYAMDPLGLFSTPVSLTEAAIANGMKTGIVTTDSTAGATPSGFSVHCISRSFEASISAQQIKTDIDLIWGDTCEALDTDAAEENGFEVITTKDEMNALTPDSRSFGQFSGNMWQLAVPEDDASPNLTEMTEKAISLLDNEDGFFLMVEGAHIDKHSHKTDDGVNYPEKVANAAEAVEEFDNAVEAAVSFAREDGETLVVVTADHETGGITIGSGHSSMIDWAGIEKAYEEAGETSRQENRAISTEHNIGWASYGHTGGPVPIYAIGKGAGKFCGRMDNTDIYAKVVCE